MRRATVVVFYVISGMIYNVLPVSGSIFGCKKLAELGNLRVCLWHTQFSYLKSLLRNLHED